jgi:hypothetical protein
MSRIGAVARVGRMGRLAAVSRLQSGGIISMLNDGSGSVELHLANAVVLHAGDRITVSGNTVYNGGPYLLTADNLLALAYTADGIGGVWHLA